MIQPIKQTKLIKWRSLVAERQASGESVAAFCRTRELSTSQFYYWEKRLRGEGKPQFVELEIAKPFLRPKPGWAGSGSSIEVRLRNGRSLMVPADFDASHLRALLAIVESWS